MTVFEITQTEDIDETIQLLKGNTKEKDVEAWKSQYNVEGHNTLNKSLRQDKIVKDDEGNTRIETVNRIVFPLQKRIVNSTVSFTFGNPVKLNANPETEKEHTVFNAIQRILYENKINSFNRKVLRDLLCCTEVAEIWFKVDTDENENYGFKTPFKLRSLKISPWDGNTLYPKFDATGDMIAFSREYQIFEDGSGKVKYFEVFTDKEIIRYKFNSTGSWEIESKIINPIDKIPVTYCTQEQVDWHDLQYSIDRLEYLLSNFGDTNDYHAAPKIFVTGRIIGFSKKGESGAILEGDKESKAEYLSWDHAPESVKLEIETLFKMIYSLTQTPDISFDNLKNLNQVSGIALQMLFMDAHLKVQEKREVLDEYLQRRINIIKAYIGNLNLSIKKECDSLQVEPEIVPFMIDDIASTINDLMSANGGNPIISQKTSIAKSGLVADAEAEYLQIQEEQKLATNMSAFPTAS